MVSIEDLAQLARDWPEYLRESKKKRKNNYWLYGQFYSRGVSVPALLTTLDLVERGGTLRSVLIAAASALRAPLNDFMQRVM